MNSNETGLLVSQGSAKIETDLTAETPHSPYNSIFSDEPNRPVVALRGQLRELATAATYLRIRLRRCPRVLLTPGTEKSAPGPARTSILPGLQTPKSAVA